MELHLQQSYKSIKEFPKTDLPSFTLITGLNGSGKTHFLNALQQGAIRADGIEVGDVRFFSWTDMNPQDNEPFAAHTLAAERVDLFQLLDNHRKPFAESIVAVAREVGVTGGILNDVSRLAMADESELRKHLSEGAKAEVAVLRIREAVKSASTNIESRVNRDGRLPALHKISAQLKKPLVALSEEDFSISQSPSWGTSQIFQQQFGRLFVQYQELWRANQLLQHASSKGEDVKALTDLEFCKEYMIPPWDFVNQSMESAGLDFIVNQPSKFESQRWSPNLGQLSKVDRDLRRTIRDDDTQTVYG